MPRDWGDRFILRLEKAIKDDRDLIEECRPSLVVTDARWSMSLACRDMGIATVEITNRIWASSGHGLPQLIRTKLTNELGAVRSLIERAYGSRIPDEVLVPADSSNAIFADVPELFPAMVENDSPTVGPLVWSDGPVPDWPVAKGPRVYMTSGSTGNHIAFRRIARFLARHGCSIILSGGPDWRPPSESVRWVSFVGGTDVLRSADLAVIHGGSGVSTKPCLRVFPVWSYPVTLIS